MNEYVGFDIPPVTEENLRFLQYETSVLTEAVICELSELADAVTEFAKTLFDAGFGIYEILSLVAEGAPLDSAAAHDFALEENRIRLSVAASALGAAERAAFSDLLTERLRARGIDLTERSFLPSVPLSETFTCVKNAFSDEAFDVFSQEFSDPRLKYSASFKEAVRRLTDGEVSYALLPLEESGGTRLPTVLELIYRNDLKINSVTSVFGQGADTDLKYALVSKTLTPPEISAEDDRYLEIRLSQKRASALVGIILAAESFGIEIYRVNTITLGREDAKESFYTLVFRGEGCDFTRLLTFLTLFTEDFVPVGTYKNLE